jgi:BlaI family transcriptional regulator, penicillinase repressor
MTQHQLPDAELDVMACLWRGGRLTAREVREALAQKRPMAHASVCTLLKRLEDKGLVARSKGSVGKAFVYQAQTQVGATRRRLLGELLDRLFGGSGVALVSSLLESRPPTRAELDELQSLLDGLRGQASRGRTDSRQPKADSSISKNSISKQRSRR